VRGANDVYAAAVGRSQVGHGVIAQAVGGGKKWQEIKMDGVSCCINNHHTAATTRIEYAECVHTWRHYTVHTCAHPANYANLQHVVLKSSEHVTCQAGGSAALTAFSPPKNHARGPTDATPAAVVSAFRRVTRDGTMFSLLLLLDSLSWDRVTWGGANAPASPPTSAPPKALAALIRVCCVFRDVVQYKRE
jgi:hypothetical protein